MLKKSFTITILIVFNLLISSCGNKQDENFRKSKQENLKFKSSKDLLLNQNYNLYQIGQLIHSKLSKATTDEYNSLSVNYITKLNNDENKNANEFLITLKKRIGNDLVKRVNLIAGFVNYKGNIEKRKDPTSTNQKLNLILEKLYTQYTNEINVQNYKQDFFLIKLIIDFKEQINTTPKIGKFILTKDSKQLLQKLVDFSKVRSQYRVSRFYHLLELFKDNKSAFNIFKNFVDYYKITSDTTQHEISLTSKLYDFQLNKQNQKSFDLNTINKVLSNRASAANQLVKLINKTKQTKATKLNGLFNDLNTILWDWDNLFKRTNSMLATKDIISILDTRFNYLESFMIKHFSYTNNSLLNKLNQVELQKAIHPILKNIELNYYLTHKSEENLFVLKELKKMNNVLPSIAINSGSDYLKQYYILIQNKTNLLWFNKVMTLNTLSLDRKTTEFVQKLSFTIEQQISNLLTYRKNISIIDKLAVKKACYSGECVNILLPNIYQNFNFTSSTIIAHPISKIVLNPNQVKSFFKINNAVFSYKYNNNLISHNYNPTYGTVPVQHSSREKTFGHRCWSVGFGLGKQCNGPDKWKHHFSISGGQSPSKSRNGAYYSSNNNFSLKQTINEFNPLSFNLIISLGKNGLQGEQGLPSPLCSGNTYRTFVGRVGSTGDTTDGNTQNIMNHFTATIYNIPAGIGGNGGMAARGSSFSVIARKNGINFVQFSFVNYAGNPGLGGIAPACNQSNLNQAQFQGSIGASNTRGGIQFN